MMQLSYLWVLLLTLGTTFPAIAPICDAATPTTRPVSSLRKKELRKKSSRPKHRSQPVSEEPIVIILPSEKGKAKVYKLPKVKVRQKKDPGSAADLRDPSAFVSIIKTKNTAKKVRDLGEIVRENAGVHVRSFGGLGSSSSVSIRGSSPSQVQVLLDGVPLNHGGAGFINLGALPVDSLGEIAIFRGFVPAHLGGAMGGAISLTTHLPPGYRVSRGLFSVGSFRTTKIGFHHGQRVGKWQFYGFAHYLFNGGDFRYFDDRGTPLEQSDDLPKVRRQNNELHSTFGLFAIKAQLHPKLSLKLTDLLTFRAQGVPGIGNFRSFASTSRQLRNLLQLALDWRQFPIALMRGSSQFYWVAQSGVFIDLESEIGLGRQNLAHHTQLLGWKFFASWLPWSALSLSFSSHLRREGYTPLDLLNPSNVSAEVYRWSWAPVLQALLSLWNDKLVFMLAGRFELFHNDAAGATNKELKRWKQTTKWFPVGRAGLKVRPWSFIWLKSNIGRYLRQPTFPELFGDRGSTIGNPTLQPEAGWMWDVGAVLMWTKRGVLDRLRIEYSFFLTQSEQLIRWVQNSQRTMIAVNIDAARLAGHEARLQVGLFKMFRLQMEWTWMDARNQSVAPFERGKRLPGRPESEFFVRGEWYMRGIRVFYAYRYTSGNFLDRANLRELAARNWHDLGLSIKPSVLLRYLGYKGIWDGLTLSFEIKNVLDTRTEYVPLRPALPNLKQVPQAISDFSGYPLPGRGVYLTVNWKI